MNYIQCNVLTIDKQLHDLDIKQEAQWVRGGFILETAVGWFENQEGDYDCTTVHLIGGQSLTIDISYDEFIGMLDSGTEIDVEPT